MYIIYIYTHIYIYIYRFLPNLKPKCNSLRNKCLVFDIYKILTFLYMTCKVYIYIYKSKRFNIFSFLIKQFDTTIFIFAFELVIK